MIAASQMLVAARSAFTLGVLSIALAGCSQVQGLATQGNINVVYLESASTDVLLSQNIPLMSKPICTVDSATNYQCTGTTLTGEPVAVHVPGTNDDPIMTITVNGKQVFAGSVIEVINENAQVKG